PLSVVDRVRRDLRGPRLARPPLRVRRLPVPQARSQLGHAVMLPSSAARTRLLMISVPCADQVGMRSRRLALTLLASTLAVVGAGLFFQGVMFVEDPLIAVGIGLIVGGILVAFQAATRPWTRATMVCVVVVTTLPLAFVVWVLWKLAHETT